MIAFHEVDDVDHWLASLSERRPYGPLGITFRTLRDPEPAACDSTAGARPAVRGGFPADCAILTRGVRLKRLAPEPKRISRRQTATRMLPTR